MCSVLCIVASWPYYCVGTEEKMLGSRHVFILLAERSHPGNKNIPYSIIYYVSNKKYINVNCVLIFRCYIKVSYLIIIITVIFVLKLLHFAQGWITRTDPPLSNIVKMRKCNSLFYVYHWDIQIKTDEVYRWIQGNQTFLFNDSLKWHCYYYW